ncbi:MAG: DUF1028 domain-containing protein [bacterium]
MRNIVLVFLLTVIFLSGVCSAQSFPDGKLAHTYSVVACDAVTGEMGVAVQSHWFSVGSIVSWAESGAGAIATQSFVNASFGPRGLDLLKQGNNAEEVLQSLIASDEGRDYRQLAIVDSEGKVAVYTGKKCIAEAGHIKGDHFSVQANMMLNNTVWPAMAEAYKDNLDEPLAERLVAVLEAAQAEGGDIRGRQSAVLLVVKGESTGKPWEDRLIDLRVDDHSQPVNELKRLLKLFRAYEHMNAGDVAIENNNVEKALQEYKTAEMMFPSNLEMKYWHAVSLANIGKVEEALPIFKQIFSEDTNWRILTQRLPAVDLLMVKEDELKKIMDVK